MSDKLILLTFAMLLPTCAATDFSWKDKPIENWTADDARQILTNSPWSKTITVGITRHLNEDERREGGNMGQPEGVGVDGVGRKPARPRLPDSIAALTHGPYKAPSAEVLTLQVRWETALPIRAAELKAGEVEPPTLEAVGYKIAVYGIPGTNAKGDPASLGEPLRKDAAIRRMGKKDVKPFRVEVFETERGVVVVYLFPPSAEIGRGDGQVEFDAQIGRVVVKQVFDLSEMEFRGKLEL